MVNRDRVGCDLVIWSRESRRNIWSRGAGVAGEHGEVGAEGVAGEHKKEKRAVGVVKLDRVAQLLADTPQYETTTPGKIHPMDPPLKIALIFTQSHPRLIQSIIRYIRMSSPPGNHASQWPGNLWSKRV